MNEVYIEKIIRLITRGVITINDIKDEAYKTEVQNRLSTM